MSKPKVAYTQKYRAGTMMVKQESLPLMRHVPKELIVKSCEIKSAGHLDDGTEFQDIRVILKAGVIT